MIRLVGTCVLVGLTWFVSAQKLLVKPYLQPGNASSLSREQKVVIWQTDSVPGIFKVEFAEGNTLEGATKIISAKISNVQLRLLGKTTYLYRAALTGLDTDTEYTYRVTLGESVITKATFQSRTKKPSTRFAVFGDVGTGSLPQAQIAYQVYNQKPQFVLVTGDLAYNNGLEREYRARFFPAYSAEVPSPEKGAPLLQSIPFYLFIGNHDVYGSDLTRFPDGLAFFYYADMPMNAPQSQFIIDIKGSNDQIRTFKKNTEGRFPKMVNYSFDYGNVHITCLDANAYTNPLDNALVEWMRDDIRSSKADWKIVSCHHPGFSSSIAHYDYQQMRLLSPVLEALGVDLVLTSHVHNYQRSVPLKFSPKVNDAGDRYVVSAEGRVDGKFTLDTEFDGITKTRPSGIIHIVSGGGGGALYDTSQSNKPELWKHEPSDNWVPYTVKFISDIHSFTLVETNGKTLVLKQISAKGDLLDEIKMTK